MASSIDKRTQIYLSEEQHRQLRAVARRQGVSMARVIRTAVDRYLSQHRSAPTEDLWDSDPATALVGAFALPPHSENVSLDEAIDESLYDELG